MLSDGQVGPRTKGFAGDRADVKKNSLIVQSTRSKCLAICTVLRHYGMQIMLDIMGRAV
jgi:hypothetical protein